MIKDWDLITNLTFKTQSYRKNFDMISENEHFITECDGEITLMQFEQKKQPVIIGEYSFSVWNIGMGNDFNVNFKHLIEEHETENMYGELKSLLNKNIFNINDYNKLILVHSLVISADYRKRGVTEEFVEMLYRDHYDKKNAIIGLFLPFQDNPTDMDYYLNRKSIPIRQNLKVFQPPIDVPAMKYYSLNALLRKRDSELNQYKLFSVASRCGFERLDDSHLFIFTPEKTIERMNEKYKD